jgi:WhiB family redox-sensing transcriptional regulator
MTDLRSDRSSLDELVSASGDEWREHANCTGKLHLFFAKKAERPQARERREAKAAALCAECPVRIPCRDFARENREYGFWGGESEEERHLAGYTMVAPIGVRARLAKHTDEVVTLERSA